MTPADARNLLPEFRFLVQATRWPQDAAALADIREAAREVGDPALLLSLARRHHVTGLVARAIGQCDLLAGTPLRAQLRREALDLAAENLRQLVQTRRAVDALQREGIAVAVLKGVPAALSLYGEAGIRRSVDIDLLVARRDIERAADVLAALDYRRSDPPHDASPARVRTASRYGKDWGFDHFHSDTGIELHWRLFQNPCLLGRIGVADAALREIVPGVTLPVLPARLALLHATVHGAEHAWSRLKWLADLATALRDTGCAERLLNDTQRHRMEHIGTAALLIVQRLYGTPLPADLGLAARWRTRKLVDVAWASLLGMQDGAEMEDRTGAATRKNLSHYLFSVDPRFWWHELGYDLFHDREPGRGAALRIVRRAANLLHLPTISAAASR
ncbi:nucleotidyltransferase family protein [Novosphingobium resinovorum]|uniref:nucleotidyltransferase domain-containing protein n=1 Tax=Novosphingobium resinovorum TaxID=158500 RepID=UPI002ED4F9E7